MSSDFQLFKSLFKPLGIIPSTLITKGITVTFRYQSFSRSLARSKYLSLFSFSLIFTMWSVGTVRSSIRQGLSGFFFFFFVDFYEVWSSGRDKVIRWISKSHRIMRVSFSRIDFGLCFYHLVECSNFNFLHNSQWITFPTRSCVVFYFFLCQWDLFYHYDYHLRFLSFFLHQIRLILLFYL